MTNDELLEHLKEVGKDVDRFSNSLDELREEMKQEFASLKIYPSPVHVNMNPPR